MVLVYGSEEGRSEIWCFDLFVVVCFWVWFLYGVERKKIFFVFEVCFGYGRVN